MLKKYVYQSICLSIYLSIQSDLIKSPQHNLNLMLNLNLLQCNLIQSNLFLGQLNYY